MANASYVQDSFTGGEKSKLAQGRITDKEYRTWMATCVNGHPTEDGGWVRRSGTMYAQHTRQGRPGRVIKFDFAAATPYTMEFTDGIIRFRQGMQLAATNDFQNIVTISTANPAVVQTAGTNGWSTGNTVAIGGGPALTQQRQFVITVIDGTHFSLADAITGLSLDGSQLGALPSGMLVVRVEEVVSPYLNGQWATLRAVQAEQTATLLHGKVAPQLLNVVSPPASGTAAQFSLAPLTFLDGPYLDPPTNGVQATPSGVKGTITLTLGFATFDSAKAYKVGDFVTSSGVNYVSLTDDNVGNTPVSSPSAWATTSAGAAINNGLGFVGTDVGRLVRLFSEPATWLATNTYSAGQVVSYNPSGAPGASTYWTSLLGSNIGNIPGNDTTHWSLATNAAIWSWGKILSLANQISQGAGTIINNSAFQRPSASFDGVISQGIAIATAEQQSFDFIGQPIGLQVTFTLDDFVGKNFTGSAKQIGTVTVFPTTDFGFFNISFFESSQFLEVISSNVTMNLRAKQSAPSSASDGTLLASLSAAAFPQGAAAVVFGNAVNLVSNDQVTAWNYVWVELSTTAVIQVTASPSFSTVAAVTNCIAEVQMFAPTGTGSGAAATMEVLGPPMLYTNPCITWRLGAYSNTTGWPTNGTYHEGRIWLAGAIGNRFDASVSNGLVGTTLNMAPTDQNGVVGAANGITGVVNSDGVNPIFWLIPDLQGVLMGTQAGEWLISAPNTGPISPTNIQAVRATKIGCAFVEPRKTDHTTVFVQRYAKKVMEYFTDVYSGKFAAPNLSKDAMHITKSLVAELAYTQATIPIIWGRNTDGSWWGATYKRDTLATAAGPTIDGWHRHTLGSGRSVQSICAGPSTDGALDALTMVTLDPVTQIYHVEIMTDAVEEGDTLLQAAYLDDATNPSSVAQSATPAPYGGLTLNGLWYLNGKTVTAWLGGLDCGDYAVANGSITVPYGDGISAGTANGLFTAAYAATVSITQMLVGFTFTSQGQIVRPATPQESGARSGPAVGKRRRNHKIAAQLEGTGVGVSFGTTFPKVDPAKFRQPNDTAFLVNQQFTGIYKDTVTDDYSYDGMLCWQVTRPYPLNIANVAGFIETADE